MVRYGRPHSAAHSSTALSLSLAISDEGLVLGDGATLVRMEKAAERGRGLALETDRDRFVALMSVAAGRSVGNDTFRHIEAADRFWRRGDKALANLRLVFADLPRLADFTAAYRLTLAEHLLDEGLAPDALMKELGLELATDALKYAPDQARVPAGHGDESGRFTFGRESAVTSAARIVLASEDDEPSENKDYLQHQGEVFPTPDKDTTHHHRSPLLTPGPPPPIEPPLPAGVGPGPYAGKSIPAGPNPRPNPAQQKEINEIGRTTGCHTCGTKESESRTEILSATISRQKS